MAGSGLERWMRLIGEVGLDGWLVADFRRNNPVLVRLLGLESGILSRRCFLWVPRELTTERQQDLTLLIG